MITIQSVRKEIKSLRIQIKDSHSDSMTDWIIVFTMIIIATWMDPFLVPLSSIKVYRCGKTPQEMIAKLPFQRLPLIKSKNNKNTHTSIDTHHNYYTNQSKFYSNIWELKNTLDVHIYQWLSAICYGCYRTLTLANGK